MTALALAGCYEFHLVGPEDPSPVLSPALVTITIEYRQPNECLNTPPRCLDKVTFYGSWMRPETQVFLSADPGNHIWRGTAVGVPVNFPPKGDIPYEVWIDDPYLRDTPTLGATADRMRVGGETLNRIVAEHTAKEHALVFIDENGQGRNPL